VKSNLYYIAQSLINDSHWFRLLFKLPYRISLVVICLELKTFSNKIKCPYKLLNKNSVGDPRASQYISIIAMCTFHVIICTLLAFWLFCQETDLFNIWDCLPNSVDKNDSGSLFMAQNGGVCQRAVPGRVLSAPVLVNTGLLRVELRGCPPPFLVRSIQGGRFRRYAVCKGSVGRTQTSCYIVRRHQFKLLIVFKKRNKHDIQSQITLSRARPRTRFCGIISAFKNLNIDLGRSKTWKSNKQTHQS